MSIQSWNSPKKHENIAFFGCGNAKNCQEGHWFEYCTRYVSKMSPSVENHRFCNDFRGNRSRRFSSDFIVAFEEEFADKVMTHLKKHLKGVKYVQS